MLGKALSFDGVDDYVNAGSGASLKMGTGAITVEQWINPPTWTGYKSLFYGSAGGGNQGYGTGLDTGGTGFFYEVYGATGGRQRFTMDIGIQKNQWNHIVAVFDGVNNKMIAYLNGVQKDTRNISDPGDVPTNNGFIIGSHGGSNWFFNGLIDDFRIYNQALSAFEIQKHYAEGLGKHDNLAVK
ncbi:MAG: hypothetical protein COS26_02690 [Candidatus Nealsonbacteria bacterium CG02_land_8_20_14_3_00_40_11]|uniref:LamG-like jellyroll fold domain-containing protein n=1 Tax=Candidatus Nealsonbacteria bacterium CG02_land_8_20_14_3_00_40_11 TaxID=1974700 RepID=A0A2M7D7E5_9BACT|nr:MAG: hypothetical protein COS26_02690 [Candidatus Nealsonbacteria bacterium CG02_land_8_20_14_3_00_40_11]